jgi:hypothetical protein
MPLDAPYREPGDTIPRFTPALFDKDKLGARAAAEFYWKATNWSLATLHDDPRLLICDAAECKRDAQQFVAAYAAKHQHVHGGRPRATNYRLIALRSSTVAQWVLQADVRRTNSEVVSEAGVSIRTEAENSEVVNVYVGWNGKMWRVTKIALAPA